MIEDQINQDLKSALLSGDSFVVMTLRGLKSSLLYAKIAQGARERGLESDTVVALLQKEAKKRQESADLYRQGGNAEREAAELKEKAIIEHYLPAPVSVAVLLELITAAIAENGAEQRNMGAIISSVKQQVGPTADGATIARLVREKLAQ